MFVEFLFYHITHDLLYSALCHLRAYCLIQFIDKQVDQNGTGERHAATHCSLPSRMALYGYQAFDSGMALPEALSGALALGGAKRLKLGSSDSAQSASWLGRESQQLGRRPPSCWPAENSALPVLL